MSSLFKSKPQPQDWKEKYYQCLDELDDKQRTLEETEKHLSRSILKLTFSHIGSNAKLDGELRKFRDTLRQTNSFDQRKKHIDAIVNKIVNLSDTPTPNNEEPVDTGAEPLQALLQLLRVDGADRHEIDLINNRLDTAKTPADVEQCISHLAGWLNSHQQPSLAQEQEPVAETHPSTPIDDEAETIDLAEVLLQILERISFPGGVETELKTIKSTLKPGQAIDEPNKVLKQISDFISMSNHKLQTELTEMETYFQQVVGRLQDLEQYLLGAESTQREMFIEAQNFNDQMKANSEKLKTDVDSCQDINTIKSTLDSHLEFIQNNLDEHLKCEEKRQQETQKTIESLSKRVCEIENESIELQQAIVKEREKAYCDSLTGIPNRMAYEQKMQEEYSRWERYGHELSIAVIDIDNFKSVNDSYGHKAGDKVLQTVAKLCESQIRESDFIARYGGEEFVVILPSTDLSAAKTAANHLREKVSKCVFHYNKTEVPITVSIGVAEFKQTDCAESAFIRADSALYKAKESGRNTCLTEQDIVEH